jgi:citrate synthase
MLRGEPPQEDEGRIMDIALILHADHGLNASTFACMVTASTLSDMYSSITTGIGTLKGPLHGGANEAVIKMLKEIGREDQVEFWVDRAIASKKKIMGFGHRVYKAWDPRAKILKRLAEELTKKQREEEAILYRIAVKLEKTVLDRMGKEKRIYPNVDFYSGIVYHYLGIPDDLFTPIFAIARVPGWCAHIIEYVRDNRIFRPKGLYVGPRNAPYISFQERGS